MRIKTVWSLRTYDVWGNAKDGYEVNDTYRAGEITLSLQVETRLSGSGPCTVRYHTNRLRPNTPMMAN